MSTGRPGRWLLPLAALAMLATVGAALFVIGGPGTQRAQRLDERRIVDLSMLQAHVQQHADREGALPAGLDALSRSAGAAGARIPTVDPEGAPYRYEMIDARKYRLCARFATANDAAGDGPFSGFGAWRHPAGEHCFVRALEAGAKE